MTSEFKTSMYALAAFARRADVIGPMEVTIRFGEMRDEAYFTQQLKLEFNELQYDIAKAITSGPDFRQFEIFGIKVKIERDKPSMGYYESALALAARAAKK